MKNFITTTLPRCAGNMLLFAGSTGLFAKSLRDGSLKDRLLQSQVENQILRHAKHVNDIKESQKEAIENNLNSSGGSTVIENSLENIEKARTEFKNLQSRDHHPGGMDAAEECLNPLRGVSESDKISTTIKKCLELIKGRGSENNLLDLQSRDLINMFNKLKEILTGLDQDQIGAVAHISGSLVIFFSLITIFSTLLGDRFISYFRLTDKYPRLANFIKIRQHLLNTSLIFNIFVIFFVLITIIYINLLVLFS